MPTRQTFVLLHRWTGLAIAFFLVVASLTGILLAFEDELEVWLAPELQLAQPAPGQAATSMLDPYTLRERVQQQLGEHVQINQLILHPQPGRTVSFMADPATDPATGRPYRLAYNEILVNPYTGKVQGVRDRDKISLRPQNLMPLVFNIHHSLALPRVAGALLMGLVSTFWTSTASSASISPGRADVPSGPSGNRRGWSSGRPVSTASTSTCTGPSACGAG